MRSTTLLLAFLLAVPVSSARAQTADDLIGRYLKTIGGTERVGAAKTIRRIGKWRGGGGLEADVVQENKRGGLVREEFSLQGMTAINAYDGRTGWKVDPFNGKKDAEPLSEDEMHGILVDADFDEPLIDYKSKGSTAEYVGMDQFEGTDVYKVRVTLKSGDSRTYFLDTDSYVPIKIEEKRIIRGSEQELETTLGNYKAVDGWFVPYSIETGMKGQDKQRITLSKVEVNVPIDDARFTKPALVVPATKTPDPAPLKPIPNEEN
jgi:hypothetical protein